jgi:hypothetical protein
MNARISSGGKLTGSAVKSLNAWYRSMSFHITSNGMFACLILVTTSFVSLRLT